MIKLVSLFLFSFFFLILIILETAYNIGLSCRLLTNDMEIYILEEEDEHGVGRKLDEVRNEMINENEMKATPSNDVVININEPKAIGCSICSGHYDKIVLSQFVVISENFGGLHYSSNIFQRNNLKQGEGSNVN